ncbi:MAG: hypothetical protein [Circular genetic element sp.]|nr:MAG: hypothetical protein [Circular genetic element sp.]
MEYETVILEDGDSEVISIESERYPIDFVSGSPMTDPNIAPVATRVRIRRYTGVVRIRRPVKESPRQDMTLPVSSGRQIPKTRGGTDEFWNIPKFISAYWVKGKPKCRRGYRYDFKRKMCVKKS